MISDKLDSTQNPPTHTLVLDSQDKNKKKTRFQSKSEFNEWKSKKKTQSDIRHLISWAWVPRRTERVTLKAEEKYCVDLGSLVSLPVAPPRPRHPIALNAVCWIHKNVANKRSLMKDMLQLDSIQLLCHCRHQWRRRATTQRQHRAILFIFCCVLFSRSHSGRSEHHRKFAEILSFLRWSYALSKKVFFFITRHCQLYAMGSGACTHRQQPKYVSVKLLRGQYRYQCQSIYCAANASQQPLMKMVSSDGF